MRNPSHTIFMVGLLSALSMFGCTDAATQVQATPTAPEPSAPPKLSFVNGKGEPINDIYYTDPVAVLATGFTPGTSVRIDAEMGPWRSTATFTVAPDGTVNTARDASQEGSYVGVDVDGLFWSMDTPKFELASSVDVTFRVEASNVEAVLRRTIDIAEARAREVKDDGLVGMFVVPTNVAGPFPTILAFGGSEGGSSGGLSYARTLVRQGYAVLALTYFGGAGRPQNLADIELEYFAKAIAWLKTQPEVDGKHLGAIGGSRGGELALLLASRHPELSAVVADAPSSYVWSGIGDTTAAAWTAEGQPLPSVPYHGAQAVAVRSRKGKTAYSMTAAFEDDLMKSTPAELALARIPVEKSNAAIALFAGKQDQLWPACTFAEHAMRMLQQSGHAASHPDEVHCYEEAGHDLSSLGLPTTWSDVSESQYGVLALGGTPSGSAHAARAREESMRSFFAKTLK